MDRHWHRDFRTALVAGLVTASGLAAERPHGQADPAAIVPAGTARFTVLTPRLIRLEWSPDGRFEDRPSLVFINRRLPVPQFSTDTDSGWLKIRTDTLTLTYHVEGGAFSADNLRIEHAGGAWTPGTADDGNLLGTWRTLDSISGASRLEAGLVSRAGWTLVDDSTRLLFTEDLPGPASGAAPVSAWPWATPRKPRGCLDWYFFSYGRDYAQCLADFTAVAGRVPLPPRYVFGAWWSRYWPYSADELKRLVYEFRQHDVPLDVLVIDMDWHLDGWTGYTWNPAYFPDPQGFLDWTQRHGLKVTLNLHPAEGVGRHEAAFPAFCRAVGLDPETTDRVPFDCTDPRYVEAYFKLLHHPLERQGVDFWWMDWQQGTDSNIPGLDPLFWLNHLHWQDWERDAGAKHERPLVFSRWGGLGNHRYPIGFSGDTHSVWASLAFQPYFTATAGNVGYGYWSHDIGGHFPGPTDPELYARWIQWGALSPVLRTHTTRHPRAERRIWAFDAETFRVAREAWLLRYALTPYIYTAARACHDTAVPLCRPLYWEWPEQEEAYRRPGQYLFGPDLLAAPVTQPVDPQTNCAPVSVWLPPGTWVNWFTGRVYTGPGETWLLVPPDEIPLFARAGAIIPAARHVPATLNEPPEGAARLPESLRPVDPLVLHVFPGDRGETVVYEDDGLSQGYLRGEFARTPVRMTRGEGSVRVEIGPAEGRYADMPSERGYEVRLRNVAPPQGVRLAGASLDQATDDGAPGWSYDITELSLVVRVPPRPVGEPTLIEVACADDQAEFERLAATGLRQVRRLLESLIARAGDAAPRLAGATLGRIDAALRPGEGGVAARRTLARIAEPLVRAINSATLRDPLRTEYVSRLLGLVARLDVSGAGNGKVAATLRVAHEPLLSTAPPPLLQPALIPPAGWTTSPPRPETTPTVAGQLTTTRVEWQPDTLGRPALARVRVSVPVDGGEILLRYDRRLLASIGAWWLLGPVPPAAVARLDAELAASEQPDVAAAVEVGGLKPLHWQRCERRLTPSDDPTAEFVVDLQEQLGPGVQNHAAYALTYLRAPRDMPARLVLGSDDGCTIWLNGERVFEISIGRGYQPREDAVPVNLRAGLNRLLVRVDQLGGAWALGMHVETPTGEPVEDVEVRLEP
ncbi:MAG: DUF5110 domain-containing protein [Phycisphaerales bacterium]|nr:DUF5110 domain-containing protein [Phycisphaerales bacterium]